MNMMWSYTSSYHTPDFSEYTQVKLELQHVCDCQADQGMEQQQDWSQRGVCYFSQNGSFCHC